MIMVLFVVMNLVIVVGEIFVQRDYVIVHSCSLFDQNIMATVMLGRNSKESKAEKVIGLISSICQTCSVKTF